MVNISKILIKTEYDVSWLDYMLEENRITQIDKNNYQGKLFAEREFSPMLFVKLCPENFEITIEGSFRDCYFGENSNKNFNKSTLTEFLCYIASEIPYGSVENLFQATLVDFDWEISLDLENIQNEFISCIIGHKKQWRKNIDHCKIIFHGKSRSLTISQEPFTTATFGKESRIEKVKQSIIKFNINADENSFSIFSKENFKKVEDLIFLWEELANKFIKDINNVEITSNYSQEISQFLNTSSKRDIRDFMIYQGMASFKKENLKMLLQDKLRRKKSFRTYDKLISIHDQFDQMKTVSNYQQEFKIKIALETINITE